MTPKRKFRELPQETKDKISAANRNKPKSYAHKQHISQAMKKYWASVPSMNNSGETSTYQEGEVIKNNAA